MKGVEVRGGDEDLRHRGGREVVLGVVFFFSSRRRHTRFDCDWSSDVCSSDLSASRCSRILVEMHLELPHLVESYFLSHTLAPRMASMLQALALYQHRSLNVVVDRKSVV